MNTIFHMLVSCEVIKRHSTLGDTLTFDTRKQRTNGSIIWKLPVVMMMVFVVRWTDSRDEGSKRGLAQLKLHPRPQRTELVVQSCFE
jgi:hypothetical protein